MNYLVTVCTKGAENQEFEFADYAEAYAKLEDFVKQGKNGWCAIEDELGKAHAVVNLTLFDSDEFCGRDY